MDYQINALLQLLNPDNSINANRLLAHAIGMNETLIYSALISKYVYYERANMTENGWFYVTVYDLQESTTFAEKSQRAAIKHLVEHNLIEQKLMGIPAKRYFRISTNLEELEKLLIMGTEISRELKEKHKKQLTNGYKSSSAQTAELDTPKQPNLIRQNGGTSYSQTAEQDTSKQPNLIRPDGGTRYAQTADKTKDNKTKDNKPNLTNQSVCLSASSEVPRSDGQTDRPKRRFAEILEELGYDLSRLPFVPESEKDFAAYDEADRRTATCTIPYGLKANKKEMEEALKFLFAHSYYCSEMSDSKLKLLNSVISAMAEMTEKDTNQYQGETVRYYELIDRINEIVHTSSLVEWSISFEQEWQRILTVKRQSNEPIKSKRAFMKSCIWNWLKDYDFDNACLEIEAEGLFGKRKTAPNDGFDADKYSVLVNRF